MTYALHRVALQTPIGSVLIEGDSAVVQAIRIGTVDASVGDDTAPADSPVSIAAQQLSQYFAGRRRDFTIPLAPLTSERGMAMRREMIAIPYGQTLTYGALAKAMGSAPRAVGQACRRNPLPIIVPCHRVTSSAGPEFYSAGDGPDTKAWLIAHEARMETNR
jgi:methylated-DNA-[protein]-cysteine S-methyltransferase